MRFSAYGLLGCDARYPAREKVDATVFRIEQ
jgi:hypothetical protein